MGSSGVEFVAKHVGPLAELFDVAIGVWESLPPEFPGRPGTRREVLAMLLAAWAEKSRAEPQPAAYSLDWCVARYGPGLERVFEPGGQRIVFGERGWVVRDVVGQGVFVGLSTTAQAEALMGVLVAAFGGGLS